VIQVMDSLNLDHTVLITVAVIVSMTRVVRLLFASLRVCVQEYYDFRAALRAMRERAQAARLPPELVKEPPDSE
jgi:hypothetical protein